MQSLFERVLIPPAVFHEVVILGAGRPGAKEADAAAWIETHAVQNQLAVKALAVTLGLGESEAIVLASEYHADFIILDDWKARQMALELSLPVIGTVAVLNKAAEKGILVDLQTTLEELRKAGFRFPLP